MKKIISISVALFFCMAVFGQRISKITITGTGSVSDIVIGLDENVQVYISKEGQITKWGFDRFIGYQENYNDYLEPYVGRVEYYSENDDIMLRGKVKYIGKTMLSYYPSYELESLRGKLKSIGSLNMVYYQAPYDDKAMAGNLKTIGQQNFEWYGSFENEGLRGKLKNAGGASITFYGAFEDKAFRGKVKSIGSNYFTYYSSTEQYAGSIKSGATTVTANGIKFFIR